MVLSYKPKAHFSVFTPLSDRSTFLLQDSQLHPRQTMISACTTPESGISI